MEFLVSEAFQTQQRKIQRKTFKLEEAFQTGQLPNSPVPRLLRTRHGASNQASILRLLPIGVSNSTKYCKLAAIKYKPLEAQRPGNLFYVRVLNNFCLVRAET